MLHQFSTPTDEILVRLTEIIPSDDPRAKDPRMAAAIKEEVRDLLRRGTFKVILSEEIPDVANVLTARYVLAIKSKADGSIKFKTRYVIGGHKDILKHYLVHGAHTLWTQSVRVMIALAATLVCVSGLPTLS